MAVFEHSTQLPCSAEGLFDFLTQPHNAARVANPDLGLKFVDPPERISEGVELEFQITSFGSVHTLKHMIVEVVRPNRVVEEQTHGPMQAWKHIHVYESVDGGCFKHDRVEFEPPGGMIGFILTESKIKDNLADGFFAREQVLKDLIESGEIS